jgi:hypothetical protein
MTRDDIIRMAREACDPDKVEAWSNGFWTITQEELERFAFLVAKAERKGDDMKQLIECSTCGYPLTPEEREGLVEIDGKMCKPREWKSLTDEDIDWIKGSANRALGYIRVTAAKLKEKNT